MALQTAAGATLSIGTTATVAAGDDYDAISNVVGIPEYGRAYAEIKFSPLSSRAVLKFKGSYDDGNLSVSMGKDTADAGQAALIAAMATDDDYNFKVVDLDTTTQYFKAKVMSYTTTRDGTDNVIMATALLSIKSGSLS
jgi:hypothetical protein